MINAQKIDACGCLHVENADNTSGICAFLNKSCNELISCELTNNSCSEPYHICVRHPRCSVHPVCYPISMIDQRICASLPITNTTTATRTTITTQQSRWTITGNMTAARFMHTASLLSTGKVLVTGG